MLCKWINLLVQPLESKAQSHENYTKRNQYLFMIMASLITGTHVNFLNVVKKAHEKEFTTKQKRDFRRKTPAPTENAKNLDEFGIPFVFTDVLDPKVKITVAEVTSLEWYERDEWNSRVQSLNNLDVAKLIAEEDAKPKPKKGIKPAPVKPKKPIPKCSYHKEISDNKKELCPNDPINKKLGECLDFQFNYLLTLAAELPAASHPKIAIWLDTLSRTAVADDACAVMKSIRNDHIALLLGYMFHDEIKGPFELEPVSPLEPIGNTIATYAANERNQQKSAAKSLPLNPVSDTIEAFMDTVPRIEEGAFALLSITGNFFNQ